MDRAFISLYSAMNSQREGIMNRKHVKRDPNSIRERQREERLDREQREASDRANAERITRDRADERTKHMRNDREKQR